MQRLDTQFKELQLGGQGLEETLCFVGVFVCVSVCMCVHVHERLFIHNGILLQLLLCMIYCSCMEFQQVGGIDVLHTGARPVPHALCAQCLDLAMEFVSM